MAFPGCGQATLYNSKLKKCKNILIYYKYSTVSGQCIQLRIHLQKNHFGKVTGWCEETAASIEVLSKGFSTQNRDLFPTSLGTDRVITTLVPLAQSPLSKRAWPCSRGALRAPKPSSKSCAPGKGFIWAGAFYVTRITGVKSITKSTGSWKAHIGVRSRREPIHSPVSPLPGLQGKKFMPRALAGNTGCSAQAVRGTLGAPCLHGSRQSPHLPIDTFAPIQAVLPVSNPDRALSP